MPLKGSEISTLKTAVSEIYTGDKVDVDSSVFSDMSNEVLDSLLRAIKDKEVKQEDIDMLVKLKAISNCFINSVDMNNWGIYIAQYEEVLANVMDS